MSNSFWNAPTITPRVDLGYIIGIDLGTTTCSVSIYKNGSIIEIKFNFNGTIMPSMVTFTQIIGRDGKPFIETKVGESARITRESNNNVYKTTVTAAKRLIGRKSNDQTIQEDKKNWPYKVVGVDGGLKIHLEGFKHYISPEQVAAELLKVLKQAAEDSTNSIITKAVISVPAYFTGLQRECTKKAAEIAGLTVERLINEPTCAALAYAFQHQHQNQKIIEEYLLAFDFGGGTFDVSILKLVDGVYTVLTTRGDSHLGGEDIDQALMKYVMEIIIPRIIKEDDNDDCGYQEAWNNIITNATNFTTFKRKLSQKLKEFKEQFSSLPRVEFCDDICDFPIEFSLTRAEFQQRICAPFIHRAISLVDKCLMDIHPQKNKADPNLIDKIVLVGGSTRLPAVRDMLLQRFPESKIVQDINADTAVSQGACIQAALLSTNLEQKIEGINLDDITPFPLGVAVSDGSLSVIINEYSKIPTKKTRNYTNALDNQSAIEFRIYEGENLESAIDNEYLGLLEINLGKQYKKREASVDTTFEITRDGLLQVTSVDTTTNKSVHTSIKWNGQISPGDEALLRQNTLYEETIYQEKNKYMRTINRFSLFFSIFEKQYLKPEFKWLISTPTPADIISINKLLEAAKDAEKWLKGISIYDRSIPISEYQQRTHLLAKNPILALIENELHNNRVFYDDVRVHRS